MTGESALDRFLHIDPRDVGCEQALAVLHIYVEAVLADGTAAAARCAGVETHCSPAAPAPRTSQGCWPQLPQPNDRLRGPSAGDPIADGRDPEMIPSRLRACG